MAGKNFKDIFGFINKFGDATVTETTFRPASGRTLWTFGRSEECDFVYPAAKVSRQHCKIEYISSHFYITDLGSTNGTFLNGKRIEHKERIFTGDVITIGGVDIVFSRDMLF